jgi:hypothetical protein
MGLRRKKRKKEDVKEKKKQEKRGKKGERGRAKSKFRKKNANHPSTFFFLFVFCHFCTLVVFHV